jgi:hypothetical protein
MSLTAAAVDRDLGCRVSHMGHRPEGAGRRRQQFLNLQWRRRDKEAAHAGSESKGIKVSCMARPGAVEVHAGRDQASGAQRYVVGHSGRVRKGDHAW